MSSLRAVMSQHGKACRHLRGSCLLIDNFSRASLPQQAKTGACRGPRSAPGLGSFAPPGLVLARQVQRKCTRKYVPLSIVTEALASFYKSPLRMTEINILPEYKFLVL